MRGKSVAAVLAGVAGLVAASALVVANVVFISKNMGDSGLGFGDLPGPYKALLVVRFAVAAVLVLGVIVTLVGKLFGAITLAVGGVLGVLAVVTYPYLLGPELLPPDFDLGAYFSLLFRFPHAEYTFSVVALFASPLATILALLAAMRRSHGPSEQAVSHT